MTERERKQELGRKIFKVAVARGFGANITKREAYRIGAASIDTDTPPARNAALVEKESAFENVFGHDAGSILHGLRVTRPRFFRLLAHIAKGGISNGVGYVQVTWPGFLKNSLRVWRPKFNLRWGFK